MEPKGSYSCYKFKRTFTFQSENGQLSRAALAQPRSYYCIYARVVHMPIQANPKKESAGLEVTISMDDWCRAVAKEEGSPVACNPSMSRSLSRFSYQ